jgi:hypothetical protein
MVAELAVLVVRGGSGGDDGGCRVDLATRVFASQRRRNNVRSS